MFEKAKRPMYGFIQFESRGFDLTKVAKGRDSWKGFLEMMRSEEYE